MSENPFAKYAPQAKSSENPFAKYAPQAKSADPATQQKSDLYWKVRPVVAPLVEMTGAAGGSLLGAGAGTLGVFGIPGPPGTIVGGVAGAGLGYGTAKELLELADTTIGGKAPRQGATQITEPLKNVLKGGVYEMGGQAVGSLAASGIGKLINLASASKVKAGKIARDALGPDLAIVHNMLRRTKDQSITAAQATADINSPTWQALNDRALARDPRFLNALDKSQGEESFNTLAGLAGGTNAAELRGTLEAGKEATRNITTPMRDAALSRANLGKEVARLESLSAELGEQASAKVQEVRRLMELGELAKANARLSMIKRDLPVGLARYTYFGELGDKAFNEWSNKAASASLDLGQGARFAKDAANNLRSMGIKPLKSEPLVRSLKVLSNNPEFAGNDVLIGSLRNVSDDISKWTDSGGVIDARALDAIRKNSVNAAIQQLRPGMDATSQRNLAAGILSKTRPMIDDAIEAAGGEGYKGYLNEHARLSQEVAEKQLTGEALKLWNTDKKAFVDLVQNQSPEMVEKVLGPRKYDIATNLPKEALDVLQSEASKAVRNSTVADQADKGKEALRVLLMRDMSKIRLPSYLSVRASTTNKALDIIENRIGDKTMGILTEAMKTPNGAVNLLESLPAGERIRVLSILRNPATWGPSGRAIHTGGTIAGFNALFPDRNKENKLAR